MKPGSNLKGFTLIEVLIALGILSTVILGASQAYLKIYSQFMRLLEQKLIVSELTLLFQKQMLNPHVPYFSAELWRSENINSSSCSGSADACTPADRRTNDIADFSAAIQHLHQPRTEVQSCSANYHCLSIQWHSQELIFPVGFQHE